MSADQRPGSALSGEGDAVGDPALVDAADVGELTDREQDIMLLFATRAGDTIPRQELIGNDTEVGERTIDVQINRLRRKIEDDPANPVWLQTVRGIGYRLSMD